jgi:hypothetical protein
MRGRISSVAATADEILARGAVIHKLPPPGWGRLLRSLMHNCETDISGDCPFMPSSVAGGMTGAKRCVMPYSARSRHPSVGIATARGVKGHPIPSVQFVRP